jgi:hypothetical protein
MRTNLASLDVFAFMVQLFDDVAKLLELWYDEVCPERLGDYQAVLLQ